jgi:hypothetical protein
MVCGHSLFEIDIGKQITCPYIRTAHKFLLLLSTAQESDSCSNVSLAAQFFSSLLGHPTAQFFFAPLRAPVREAISWGIYTAPIDYFEADFATASLSRFITSSPHALANGRSDVLMVRSPTFCTNLMTISS